MPDYIATFHYIDDQNGDTTKQFTGTFVDNATAQTAFSGLLTALQNATDAHIDYYTLAERGTIAGAAADGTTVFERVSATVSLVGKVTKANLTLPSPVAAIMAGNALNVSAAQWLAVEAALATGQWSISDGDHVADTVSGSRVYRASGETNLPS